MRRLARAESGVKHAHVGTAGSAFLVSLPTRLVAIEAAPERRPKQGSEVLDLAAVRLTLHWAMPVRGHATKMTGPERRERP
jgi:hypothetical protein